ncbi:MAG: hypothetical protein KDD14_19675 [Saprospiraceae bacterium]|nr:hypothetical protein [Saprospiraceae bacterium]
MNEDVLEMLKSGRIPYRFTYDTASALYFGLTVLVLVFLYAAAQAVARRFIG